MKKIDTRYLNYDRGNKKWTSLMIPEHVEMLRQFANEEYYKTPKPMLDPYQVQEIEEKIHYAAEYHLPVKFDVWYEGLVEKVSGHIHYLDPIQKEIRVKDNEGNVERVKFENIVNVEVEDT
ncbi:YolD-like family protein [Bacillus smithii]|uniref:YolD-like family protein n=1 Tax=Bacillus smithii TaxID=1479 RepID=UPI003D1DB8AB